MPTVRVRPEAESVLDAIVRDIDAVLDDLREGQAIIAGDGAATASAKTMYVLGCWMIGQRLCAITQPVAMGVIAAASGLAPGGDDE